MPKYLVTHKGHYNLDEDEFSHTLVVDTDEARVDVLAARIGLTWLAVLGDSNVGLVTLLGTKTSYSGVSVAEILNPTTGQLAPATHYNYPYPIAGNGSGNTPPQVSVCISLTAGARPNGQPIKGRFYLPPPHASLYSSVGRLSNPDSWAGFIGEYFAALNDAQEPTITPVVWSRTLGTFSAVQSVRVGDVLDTVRSRRNALVEQYTTATNWP